MSMYETIGTNKPLYLLADPEGADVIAIPVAAGKGTIERGTVMFKNSAGAYEAAAAADVTADNYLAVIDETVDTDAETNNEDARAYRMGKLVEGKVTLKDGAALTDATKQVLRLQGIVFEQLA